MTKVLLDTDIGTDIDDAVCLAYLLQRPDCELLGITTVTGQPVERIEKDTDRNNFMSPEEAKNYGLIDKVLESRALVAAAAAR